MTDNLLSSVASIRLKLVVLYLLNIIDMLMTDILLRTGCFYELNPFMRLIYNKPINFYIVKSVLPAILVAYLIIRVKRTKQSSLLISNLLINVIFAVYICINAAHIFNFLKFACCA
ncbi:MAG TPA: hypothetical protein DCP97_03545 [Ruminococcaceae bacterium]|nr:hypothetical protein [Oscillospiraceae bacterium]